MSSTNNYYDKNAPQFFSSTVDVDMSALHERFLAGIPAKGLILDAGCGSGRDSRAFLNRGYRVRAFDASAALCELASRHIGQAVEMRGFDEVDELLCYDGIWACASLLHLPGVDMDAALARLWAALKPNGVFYLSFKLGEGERVQDGRHFTDATEARIRAWIAPFADLAAAECWTTQDQRPGRTEQWINALIRKRGPAATKLIVGGERNHFLPHLCAAISQADEIDLAVAFIKTTGLRLLLPDLRAALTHQEGEAKDGTRAPVRLRVVTSDYLDVTDPEALRLLMLLKELGAQIRVFESAGSSFHMKAYLFAHLHGGNELRGTAFIGSSNISRQALKDGLEWNYRVDYPGDDGFLQARSRFEELFRHPRTVELTDYWIDAYERRRVQLPQAVSPGSNEVEPPPVPSSIQREALQALVATRVEGYRRGLVVLATGLGKTWLAAFDSEQVRARRVLFVAHREEILQQAAETFLRIRPAARVGFYAGQVRDRDVDVLCASVQTLGRAAHLEGFVPQHFDYIVIDEFHHAAAPTYRRLLAYFEPRFLLGLTATPDRTDQSDILSLCDDNLVFTCQLFAGIEAELLVPFHYYGIYDESVDYTGIPWRNGRFDPEQLSNKLATLARARHALRLWQSRAQARTLAFCVSIRHAEYMAEQFQRAGIPSAAVYAGSAMSRGDALEQLAEGRLKVIFSVDLFNEGVDLPAVDTVMMLRPTESKILFLQQLGRGLRKAPHKDKLVVLDFIGNHHSFLHKPQALLAVGTSYRQLAAFARKLEGGNLELPDGCFINYDLQLIEFLKSLDSDSAAKEYEALKGALGRRPSLAEFYRAGVSVSRMRQQHGSWFELVLDQKDLSADEESVALAQKRFLREVENTAMTKSYKMVLLEALQELHGWLEPPTLHALASQSWRVLQRRRPLLADLPATLSTGTDEAPETWLRYWKDNPVNAWIGGNRTNGADTFFRVLDDRFVPTFVVAEDRAAAFSELVQELVDYRLAAYEVRKTTAPEGGGNVIPLRRPAPERTELPYFPNLRIACGHFRTGRADAEEHRSLGAGYGRLDPARHFIARASGNSMDGGKHPIRDGDYLLLELISPGSAGSITGATVAIERGDGTGDNQYLLRVVTKGPDGQYVLKANNPAYEDMASSDEMRTLARFKAVIDPLELMHGERLTREEIPALFGEAFNPGNWNSGHVVLANKNAHILLVTLNKQGKAEDHRYLDHWIDEHSFHWQSQNATTPESKRGREIIEHQKKGLALHLFVREHKLEAGKAAPFTYYGQVRYVSHTGSAPMSVVFAVGE